MSPEFISYIAGFKFFFTISWIILGIVIFFIVGLCYLNHHEHPKSLRTIIIFFFVFGFLSAAVPSKGVMMQTDRCISAK